MDRVRRTSLCILLAAIGLAGCGDGTSKPPALLAMNDVPVATRVQLQTLVALEPNRTTQLVTTAKAIYALQTDAGTSAGLIEITDGRAVPTALTSEAIATSMSLPKARGQIISVAADGDRIAFCFAGVNGQKPVVSIGSFNPANGEIFTTVDAFSIERVDPDFLTSSVRPFLYVDGKTAWLVRVEKSTIRIIKIQNLRSLQPEVTAQRIELGPIQDAITRSAWDFSPATTPGTFYLTDTASRWIRTFDAGGAVHHVARFDESISSISPAAIDAAGRVLVLASDRDGVNNTLLVQNGDAFKSLPVSGFQAADLDPTLLRIDRLIGLPGKANRFIAYDGTSGKVFRITLQ